MSPPSTAERIPFRLFAGTSGHTGLLQRGKNPKRIEVFVNKDATEDEIDLAVRAVRTKLQEMTK